jgi:uncharacterized DUF497 family protein
MLFEWDERKRETNLAKHLIGMPAGFSTARFSRAWTAATDRRGLCGARQTAADYFGKEGKSE